MLLYSFLERLTKDMYYDMYTLGHCISTTASYVSNWCVTEPMYSCILE